MFAETVLFWSYKINNTIKNNTFYFKLFRAKIHSPPSLLNCAFYSLRLSSLPFAQTTTTPEFFHLYEAKNLRTLFEPPIFRGLCTRNILISSISQPPRTLVHPPSAISRYIKGKKFWRCCSDKIFSDDVTFERETCAPAPVHLSTPPK